MLRYPNFTSLTEPELPTLWLLFLKIVVAPKISILTRKYEWKVGWSTYVSDFMHYFFNTSNLGFQWVPGG